MSTHPICTADNLFDFFHEAVDAAVASKRASVSEDGVYYLSNLLAKRGRMPDVALPETLVDLQIEAAGADEVRALHCLRELGDKALYVSGFFRSSLLRRSVSVDYYLSMGATAYEQVAHRIRHPGVVGGLDEIYGELAEAFEECAEVLVRVRDAVRAHTHSDIIRLYEEWILTGDASAAERLRAVGVVPMRPGETEPGC